ncbi:hypothetical protein C2845_PM07G18430 [Panicum miliaceum]|uniref:polynucleotide adenylyltransferase n=1 Tax=Panicum miliaceum TaxID=4540 RepID=A0A3L6STV7_PANMI|nr:hypothetical protein C2845_PM07G18430 [Panicum miliaceum]
MEAEADAAATTTYVYDALPGLSLAFSPEEALDDGAEPRPTPAAAGQDEDDATSTYAVFRNEITAAGDALVDIPAADFFSLDVSASASVEAEAEPASPQAPAGILVLKMEKVLREIVMLNSDFCGFSGRFSTSAILSHLLLKNNLHGQLLCKLSPMLSNIYGLNARQVEVFGSFRTGLYLPTSDIDVVIFESGVKTPQLGLYGLAKALSQKGVARKIQVIAKARVPIVKFVETKSGIAFDISFDIDGGPQAADFIKDAVKKLPALRPLCMILKVFLHQRELNEVYSGGIGSYALLTMLITHLQLMWGEKDILGYRQPKEHNLGILLVKFFDFYGRKLNHYDVGISCNSANTFFLKSDKDFMNLDRPHLLAIQDPMVPDNDIGKNSFNYFKVKSAFSKAYSVLTDANLITNLGPKRSILGTIVRPDSVLLDRKGWNEDKLPDMLTEPWEPVTRQFDSENDVVYNWHVIDEDEPLPRNSQSTSEDTSSSPSKKRKSSKSKQKSRRKSKADVSGSSNAANGFKEDRASKREAGSSKRRKGPREYDRFTNTLPQYTHVSRW